MGQTQHSVNVRDSQADKGKAGVSPEQSSTLPPETQKGSVVNSFSLVEQLIKIAGLLAVFGYMELRAHLNYLGVSSTAALGLERYLGEFYAMCTDLLFRAQVLSSLILLVILVVAVVLIAVRTVDRKGKARELARGVLGWLRGHATSLWLPGTLLLFLISFQLWFLNQLSQEFTSSTVVGELVAPMDHRKKGETLFSVLVCVLSLAALPAWILSRRRDYGPDQEGERGARWLWRIYALVIAILGLVYLPNLYGAFVREASYPRVSVKSDAPTKMCGLLVLQTADDMRIWTFSNKTGRIIVVKTSDAGLVVTGVSADLIELAEKAVKGIPVDYCPH